MKHSNIGDDLEPITVGPIDGEVKKAITLSSDDLTVLLRSLFNRIRTLESRLATISEELKNERAHVEKKRKERERARVIDLIKQMRLEQEAAIRWLDG